MSPRWIYAALLSSGFAGLVYQVSWTRLFALYLGHSTAAASTVVATFMAGIAIGSAIGGRWATARSPRGLLMAYATVELVAAAASLGMQAGVSAFEPILASAYQDGAAGWTFAIVRWLGCVILLLPPSLALGATLPIAAAWMHGVVGAPSGTAGRLYAVNTIGAAIGAVVAGFILLPGLGLRVTMAVGVIASCISFGILVAGSNRRSALSVAPVHKTRARSAAAQRRDRAAAGAAVVALAMTGFATFLYEIAWARTLAMIVGPSSYAFSSTLAGFIGGLAVGSGIGAEIAAKTRRPALLLAIALAATAVAATWASSSAGSSLPQFVIAQMSQIPAGALDSALPTQLALVIALVAPSAMLLGFAFPLALSIAGSEAGAARLGALYAVNTMTGVAGAIAAGFLVVPWIGLQQTIRFASALLVLGSLTVLVASRVGRLDRLVGIVAVAGAVCIVLVEGTWDRELIAAGGYKYARGLASGSHAATAKSDVPFARLDGEITLRAGTLLYYREGAAGTVSVKRRAGELSLAIDGKVDASTSGDMMTQKLLAHLPLLVHGRARKVAIVGLGSGVTVASALVHPIASVDVVELSPEVVEASRFFDRENRHAIDDPRTRLISGDGRTHLALTRERYDVIVSEPSNPWMAGVAALFTREFFGAARARLRPGGLFCQWAHTYDISEADLRSIVATFAAVFPTGTMWLVGDGDLLLVGGDGSLDERLENVADGFALPAVAADLIDVSVLEPFALLSLYAGGPKEMARYAGTAPLQTDDRMALEYSGPHALYGGSSDNSRQLLALAAGAPLPAAVAGAFASAGAAAWRGRGAMMAGANAFERAFDDYALALAAQPSDSLAAAGLSDAALALDRADEASALLTNAAGRHPDVPALWIARSRLEAASGSFAQAVQSAERACDITPLQVAALEHLASLYADAGDVNRLDRVVGALDRGFPDSAGTAYYAASARYLRGQLPDALRLAELAVARDPKLARAHNLAGAVLASGGSTAAARRWFESALSLSTRDSAIYVNLGWLELSTGRRSAAAGLFAEALSLNPLSEAARRGLAEVWSPASPS